METGNVKEHFAKQAGDYERLMTRLVPHYLEQHEVMLRLIPFARTDNITLLDLGCGPGVLAELVLDAFPQARVVAFDLTEQMLEACGKRLARYGQRFTLQQGDFRSEPLGHGYDLVMAGLSLHHLDHAEKQEIYKRIFAALNPNGFYLAREIIVDPSPVVTKLHYRLWREFMRAQGEDDAVWYAKHREKDHPAAIESHRAWLAAAGFTSPACHWQYCNFAILSAGKTGEPGI